MFLLTKQSAQGEIRLGKRQKELGHLQGLSREMQTILNCVTMSG